ncbi:hypothetical protein FS749_010519, partial [Ceratobasidium sp. UAMH 11750]
ASRAPTPQPTSTQRENRRADKVVAEEEARTKAAEAKDKSQSSAATSSKASGKRRADPPREPTAPPPSVPRHNEGDDEEEVSYPSVQQKVKAGPRNQARIVSPEASPAPATTNKQGKAAQAPKAPRKLKADNAPATETEPVEEPQEPPTKKAKIRPKMSPNPNPNVLRPPFLLFPPRTSVPKTR